MGCLLLTAKEVQKFRTVFDNLQYNSFLCSGDRRENEFISVFSLIFTDIVTGNATFLHVLFECCKPEPFYSRLNKVKRPEIYLEVIPSKFKFKSILK